MRTNRPGGGVSVAYPLDGCLTQCLLNLPGMHYILGKSTVT